MQRLTKQQEILELICKSILWSTIVGAKGCRQQSSKCVSKRFYTVYSAKQQRFQWFMINSYQSSHETAGRLHWQLTAVTRLMINTNRRSILTAVVTLTNNQSSCCCPWRQLTWSHRLKSLTSVVASYRPAGKFLKPVGVKVPSHFYFSATLCLCHQSKILFSFLNIKNSLQSQNCFGCRVQNKS